MQSVYWNNLYFNVRYMFLVYFSLMPATSNVLQASRRQCRRIDWTNSFGFVRSIAKIEIFAKTTACTIYFLRLYVWMWEYSRTISNNLSTGPHQPAHGSNEITIFPHFSGLHTISSVVPLIFTWRTPHATCKLLNSVGLHWHHFKFEIKLT